MTELRIRCECGKGLLISAEHAGRTGKCPQCGRTVDVPESRVFERLSRQDRVSVGDLETQSLEGRQTPSPAGHKRHTNHHAGSPQRSTSTGLWQPGETVAELYDVKRSLGEGGFGTVWLVHHNQWDLDLAVKELRLDKESDRRRQQFLREANTWVELQMHPHVVTAWYVRELEGNHYLFLEYCDGGSLHDWIQGGRTRDLKTVLDIGIQLAWGLAHCHQQGIVHRDFKPLNVMMTKDGTAKITDFGMVRFAALEEDDAPAVAPAVTSDFRQTMGGQFRGTAAYMPPEQWAGGAEPRSDLYALGVTLYELLTGRVPIAPQQDRSVAAWMTAHSRQKPADIRKQRPDLPNSLVVLIEACLAKGPAARPADAMRIAESLKATYLESIGEAYARPTPGAIQPLADGLNNRAVSLMDLGRLNEAETVWREALDADRHHPQTVYNLGLVEWRSGRIDDLEMVRRLQQSCELYPDSMIVKCLLARVHLERADFDAVLHGIPEPPSSGAEAEHLRSAARQRMEQHGPGLRSFTGHEARVNAVSISPDGRLIVSGSDDRTVRLWNVTTGDCLRTLEGHRHKVTSVCLTGDGRYALSGSDDKRVKLWDVENGDCIREFAGHTGAVSSVCVSDDGERMLSASWDRTLRWWDLRTGRCLQVLEGHDQMVTSACLVGAGKYAISGSYDKTVRVWDLGTGKCLRTCTGHEAGITSVCISRDGRRALSASYDRTVRLWDVAKETCLKTYECDAGRVSSVCVSADGRYAISGLGNDSGQGVLIRLWDVDTGMCLRSITGTSHPVRSVAISANGRIATWGTADPTCTTWTMSRERPAISYELSKVANVRELLAATSAFAQDLQQADKALAENDAIGCRRLLHQARQRDGYQRHPVAADRWAALYRILPRTEFHGGWEVRTFSTRDTAPSLSEARDPAVGANVLQEQDKLALAAEQSGKSPHEAQVRCLCVSDDGRYLFAGSHRVHVWDVESGECVHTIAAMRVESVCATGDGGFALVGGVAYLGEEGAGGDAEVLLAEYDDDAVRADSSSVPATALDDPLITSDPATATDDPGRINRGGLQLWDVANRKFVRMLSSVRKPVALSPGGRFVTDGSSLKDVGTCQHALKFDERHAVPKTYHPAAESACFSSDGRLVLVGRPRWYDFDGHLGLWEAQTGRFLKALDGYSGDASSVGLSSNGRFALSTTGSTLSLWDLESGRRLRTFEGHQGDVTSVCFSFDSRFILSGSADGTVKLWGLDAERCLWTFTGHRQAVTCVSFSRDGRYAFSGSDDGTVKMCFLDWGLEEREWADWDEAARPYLQTFLTLHTPYAAEFPKESKPDPDTVRQALTRRGKPRVTHTNFQQLLETLSSAGYGWLRPEGVKEKLLEMAADWIGPPPLFPHDERAANA